MGSTVLTLAQSAALEMGLPVPQFVMAAQDNTGRQLGALLNRVGSWAYLKHNWTFLQQLFHITVPTPVTDTGTLTQGSTVISGLQAATTQAAQPLINQAIVSGQGIMTSVRLVGVNQNAATITIDQPATQGLTTTISIAQDSFPIPSDYGRAIDRSAWDRSMRWELRGPLSPQEDEWVRSGIVATGPRRMYRQIGNTWRIWPAPGTSAQDPGSQLITEYISKYWAVSQGNVPQAKFLYDTDTTYFDDDVMVTGLKYAFFSQKGFSFDDFKSHFIETLSIAIAADGPSPTLDMSRSNRFPIFLSPANVQDTGFGAVYGGMGGFGNP